MALFRAVLDLAARETGKRLGLQDLHLQRHHFIRTWKRTHHELHGVEDSCSSLFRLSSRGILMFE